MSDKLTRRDFLKGISATAVIAGLGSLTACSSGNEVPEATTAAAGTTAAAETTAAATQAAGAAIYTPGTYTAGADGISSKVTVTMTFDETSITDVKIDAAGETPSIGGVAAEDLQKALMDAQSAEFDGVSGATITSDAVKKAAANCIAQAKGEAVAATGDLIPTGSDEDWLGEEPIVDDADVKETVDTDILIVGAGNAGMMAAVYAAKQGLNFRVIEQNAVVQDTRHWYGAINSSAAKAAGSSVDKKKLLSEISRYASGKCDQRVVNVWMNESAAMHDFVAGILENEPYNWKCDFTAGEEARWPDSDENTTFVFPEQEHNYRASESEYGMQRNEVFLEVIQKEGYDVDFKTALVKLEKDETGRVTGVIAQRTESGDLVRYNAKQGVLLACGGYPGNPYMMQQLDPLGTSVTTACSFSPADKGYGIRAAVWAGAHLDAESAPMLFDRGLVAPGVDSGYVESPSSFGGKAFPGTVRQYNPGTQPFLKVNRHGVRFANESSPYNDIVYAAAHQPGHVYAQIMDANYMDDIKRFHTIGCSAQSRNIPGYVDKQLEQYGEEGEGLIFKADTIEELADKLGFKDDDKKNFLATVERYNELYDKQEDEDFGKMKVRLSAIKTAPFYGCWLGASLLTTEQGISINEKTQALDDENNVIPGLYIGGDMSGSFFANNYPCLMAGIACGRTLTFAMKSIKVMAGIEE
ncbi:succinate dehydrogenase/fumarate reductase flavoprotein subunit [Lachnospiraceae bacterium JC7]|nr:succinate dehydrogenase/fumarate reductase flavoprotein subunit [Lachnospiraceae bacterium JC7]